MLTQIAELFEAELPPIQRLRRVEGARVVWCDRKRLLQDFRWLAEVDLNEWLLKVGALVSEAQLDSMAVNDPFEVRSTAVTAYRPQSYGRAAVLDLRSVPDECRGEGLLDLKGCGVRDGITPQAMSHGTGLLPLSGAICDLICQRLIESALSSVDAPVTTVPVYAIISLGVDAILPNEVRAGPMPVATMLRQATRRQEFAARQDSSVWMTTQQVGLRIELLLRHFGVTSCQTVQSPQGHFFGPPKVKSLLSILGWDLPVRICHHNVQLTGSCALEPFEAQLIDFGHYSFARHFDAPMSVSAHDPVTRINRRQLLWPHDARYVQPDPRIAFDPDLLELGSLEPHLASWSGYPADSRLHGARREAIRIAHAISEKHLSAAAVNTEIEAFVQRVTSKLRAAR